MTSLIGRGSYYRKPGVIRGDFDFRGMSNPTGRSLGSVWHMPAHYDGGDHSATFSEELARRGLLTGRPCYSIRLAALARSLWPPQSWA